MNWLQGILLGFITGICEFFPVSAPAHKILLKHIFGVAGRDPVLDLVCALGALIALLMANRASFEMVQRDLRVYYRRNGANRGVMDLRVAKNAIFPMLIVGILLTYLVPIGDTMPVVALFLLLNGVMLYVPGRMLQGNKDARNMSALDSLLLGLVGGLSVLTGFSRVGLQVSVVRMRGAETRHAVNWALLLSVPALLLICILSLISLFAGLASVTFSCGFFAYLLVLLGSFIGSYISVFFIKIIAQKNSFSIFAFYCWGAALFTLIMYLV